MFIVRYCILVLLLTSASIASAADFRDSNWGSTRKQVMKAEKRKPAYQKDDVIAFEDKVAGIPVTVFYKFIDDRLVEGTYYNAARHTNKNDFIEDYDKIVSLLEKKYGDRTINDVKWKNDLFRSRPQDWGLAISMSHLEFVSAWDTNKSHIRASLAGDNYDVNHIILYFEKSYIEKLRSESNTADEKGL